jgi:hypothetical protein
MGQLETEIEITENLQETKAEIGIEIESTIETERVL